ncbi:hypothetical protein DFH07DRAFT_969483 [Mycena maculata]|uniref:Uncharacterized protein n=1 Tax=Mycena maculata TaxID=230809 RepID=A0AAD7MR89_9AGAR|nr:hypothetical protein DFH07DRAFT_969483 [Mycena maculata]
MEFGEEGEILEAEGVSVNPALAALFFSREEAEGAIKSWAPVITDPTPPLPATSEWYWNLDWLNKAIIVCDDPCAILQMKTWVVVSGITDVVFLFNMAIRYGVPFKLMVKQSDVRKIDLVELHIQASWVEALQGLYAPGFTETNLDYGKGGATTYHRYRDQVDALLKCPHTTAFIAAGGILSFLAQLYDDEIVSRF